MMWAGGGPTCPAERVSSGWISLGISQPSGPQLQANPLTNRHVKNSTPTAGPLGITASPVAPRNSTAISPATTTSATTMVMPPESVQRFSACFA